MKTVAEASEWLASLGIDDDRIQKMRQKVERENRQISRIASGTNFYLGHDKDEAEGTEDCPPFEYAWLRFDLAGEYHLMMKYKLEHHGAE